MKLTKAQEEYIRNNPEKSYKELSEDTGLSVVRVKKWKLNNAVVAEPIKVEEVKVEPKAEEKVEKKIDKEQPYTLAGFPVNKGSVVLTAGRGMKDDDIRDAEGINTAFFENHKHCVEKIKTTKEKQTLPDE